MSAEPLRSIVRLHPGRWDLRGDADLLPPVLDLLADHASHAFGARVRIAGLDLYLKAGTLRGRAAVRHALRRRLFRKPAPRLREHANLAWLRARGFAAPEPLLAGVLVRRGLPRLQLLATRWVDLARPLGAVLASSSSPDRTALLRRLGADVGRLHALGFVHRDLFFRNLLVASTSPPTLVFLDAWRGGPTTLPRPGRGPAYDLACLLLEGAAALSPEEQRELLTAYGAARSRPGHPFPLDPFLGRVARARRRLVPREAARHPELRIPSS